MEGADSRKKRKLNENEGVRPQEKYFKLYLRNRQNNLGLLTYAFPNNRPAIWKPTQKMFQPRGDWVCYIPYKNGTPRRRWIRTTEDLGKLKERLEKCDEFSISTSSNLADSRLGFICVIQISTWEYGDFFIGAVELHDAIKTELKDLLEDPAKLKIMHACDSDVLWFQRDYGIYLNGVADTQDFVWEWKKVTSISYKNMCYKFYPERSTLATDQTLSDWTLRPETGFTKEQETYAVNRVHLLLRIFDRMRHNMQENRVSMETAFASSNSKTDVLYNSQNEESVDLAAVTQNILDQLHIQNVKTKNGKSPYEISPSQHASLQALVEWRNMFSKITDKFDNDVLTPLQLFQLIELHHVYQKDIDRIVGDVSRVGEVFNKQKKIIYKILTAPNKKACIQDMKNLECHNCLRRGHGPAVFCPLPRNPINLNKWMLREENSAHLQKQFQTNRRYRISNAYRLITFQQYVYNMQQEIEAHDRRVEGDRN